MIDDYKLPKEKMNEVYGAEAIEYSSLSPWAIGEYSAIQRVSPTANAIEVNGQLFAIQLIPIGRSIGIPPHETISETIAHDLDWLISDKRFTTGVVSVGAWKEYAVVNLKDQTGMHDFETLCYVIKCSEQPQFPKVIKDKFDPAVNEPVYSDDRNIRYIHRMVDLAISKDPCIKNFSRFKDDTLYLMFGERKFICKIRMGTQFEEDWTSEVTFIKHHPPYNKKKEAE